jgi:transposase InsO family protein
MDEQQRRIQAISLYLQGEHPSTICHALGRSRPWFYKWLKLYDPSNPFWAKSQSRAPKKPFQRISQAIVQLVCSIRKRLVKTKYAQKGAVAIQWQLQQLGIQLLPGIWTINRILKRQGLLVKPTYKPRSTPYPALEPTQSNEVHQLDLVGPRYLKSKERFYGAHLIDAFSNAVALAALPNKRDTEIVQAVVASWQRLGIPDYLQVDNELSFRGSNRYPRSFGHLIRLCLYLGVEILFIPQAEPWRNGIVEKFNDVYDKLFFRRQQFKSLVLLQKELLRFETFHNSYHRYAKLAQRTPWAVHTAKSRHLLRTSFTLSRPIPWRDGKISFIRLTDHKGIVHFFSERFEVSPGLVHEYVRGTIFTKSNLLKFFHQGRIVKVYRYKVTKT